jgi:hypothetical protein
MKNCMKYSLVVTSENKDNVQKFNSFLFGTYSLGVTEETKDNS